MKILDKDCFIDTSALFSLLDNNDQNSNQSSKMFSELIDGDYKLITSNYVILESTALIQRRLGFDALLDFSENFIPVFDEIIWVDDKLHFQGMSKLKLDNRRDLSLVDCVSFEIILNRRINKVFAFDNILAKKDLKC